MPIVFPNHTHPGHSGLGSLSHWSDPMDFSLSFNQEKTGLGHGIVGIDKFPPLTAISSMRHPFRIPSRRTIRMGVFFIALSLISLASPGTTLAQHSTRKVEGLDANPPAVYALTGATVHVDSKTTIDNATIVIVRERISAIGTDVEVPKGAMVIDLAGKHVYPGFIDPHLEVSIEWSSVTGTAYWNDNVRPQLRIADWFDMDLIKHEDLRKAGITTGLFAPDFGVIRGQSCVLLTSPVERELAILSKDVAQHVLLTVDRRAGRGGYPNSPMGAYALARQAMYDAQWYNEAKRIAKADPAVDRPETNAALEALLPVVNGEQRIMVSTSNEIFALRADRFAREFGLRLAIVGSGAEYRHLDQIAQLNRELIIPVNFPKPPEVGSPEAARDVSLETLMDWDIAPENPARLAAAGVNFSFTSTGLEKVGDLLSRVRTAIKRGLSKETALDALTINPARFLNLADQIGSITKGKLANFVVTDGELFDAKSEIVETWVAGRQFDLDPKPLRDLAGTWELDVKDKGFKGFRLSIKSRKGKLSAEFVTDKKTTPKVESEKSGAEESKPKGDKVKPDDTVKLDGASLDGTRLVGAFNSEKFGHQGISQLSIVVATDGTGDGQLVLPDGKTIGVAVRKLAAEKSADEDEDQKEAKDADKEQGEDQDGEQEKDEKLPQKASFAVNHPLGAFGREDAPEQPASVLIKNVTVWTCGPEGKLENGAVLFGGGKILGVYHSEAELPAADMVVDGTGKHLSPGIIDCHSHSATDSGVNESGQAVTAEVRIGDFVDADSMNIYRQLAGGVTTINILHGSANPIGGQNQVVKLRWGALGEEMKFAEAPQGIKFALGENVKRSNSSQRPGEDARYPVTRMGVVEIIENSFRAAQEYRQKQADWKTNRHGLPPRTDLELEALAEILEGKRWIHCHSYRQDEILALIRTLDSHGITIGTFQHILEGYKVAEEMAEHGAMASAFADWWAYKYEVKDAIPYAGALMYRAGVNVSYNSDDAELARHLNHEAAKAVRYGGVPEEEALKFVTLNPAMQLRIDQYVGSIEVNKHADLVLWSGSPLSTMSRCEQTWVDGRKYFDLEQDAAARQKTKDMRTALIQKVLASGEEMETKDSSKVDPARLWPRYDENCGMLGHHYDDRQFNGLHQGHAHQNQ